MKKSIITIAMILFVSTCFAGPFGFEFGSSIDDYGIQYKELKPNIYEFDTAPRPHDMFESYIIRSYDGYGIMFIKAIGKDINTNTYGSDIKIKFSNVEDALDAKYGTGKLYDFLMSGSIWDDPNEWTMALLKEERMLCKFYEPQYGSNLPDGMAIIFLKATMLNRNKGYLTLEYQHPDYKVCREKAKSKQNQSF